MINGLYMAGNEQLHGLGLRFGTARGLLSREQTELAERARVSVVTIRRLESDHGNQRVAPGIVAGVRKALEEAGRNSSPTGSADVARHCRRPALSMGICARSACAAPPGCKAAS